MLPPWFSRAGMGVLLLLLAGGIVLAQEENRHTYLQLYDDVRREDVTIANPTVLRALSLGYPGFVADIQWLTFIQHVGKTISTRGFEDDVAPFMETVTDLDPHFAMPYLISLLLLDEHAPEQARAMGEKGISALCDHDAVDVVMKHSFEEVPTFSYVDICHGETALPALLALLVFDRFEDPLTAAKYYYISAHTEGASPAAEKLTALMLSDAAHREVAILLWKDLYEHADSETLLIYAANRLVREQNLNGIERAYKGFVQKNGHAPATVEELLNAGLIPPEFMEDPFSTEEAVYEYHFDETGKAKVILKGALR